MIGHNIGQTSYPTGDSPGVSRRLIARKGSGPAPFRRQRADPALGLHSIGAKGCKSGNSFHHVGNISQ